MQQCGLNTQTHQSESTFVSPFNFSLDCSNNACLAEVVVFAYWVQYSILDNQNVYMTIQSFYLLVGMIVLSQSEGGPDLNKKDTSSRCANLLFLTNIYTQLPLELID